MSVMDDLVHGLAIEVLDLEAATGDETIGKRVAEAIAFSSPTMEEAFLTAVRIRRGERRARAVIAAAQDRLAQESVRRGGAG